MTKKPRCDQHTDAPLRTVGRCPACAALAARPVRAYRSGKSGKSRVRLAAREQALATFPPGALATCNLSRIGRDVPAVVLRRDAAGWFWIAVRRGEEVVEERVRKQHLAPASPANTGAAPWAALVAYAQRAALGEAVAAVGQGLDGLPDAVERLAEDFDRTAEALCCHEDTP